MFGFSKRQQQDPAYDQFKELQEDGHASEVGLLAAALACIDELVQLQGYLDGLLAEAEETHGESQYRIDTPEFAVKMMSLLIGNHAVDTVASEVAEKLVADRRAGEEHDPESGEEMWDYADRSQLPKFLGADG